MLSLLAKRTACSFIPKPLFALNHNINPNLIRFFSGSAAENQDFNVAEYLINSCGLSAEKAARISKPISHLKSPQKPDAVRRFLEQQGFAEAEITKLITGCPCLLCCPEKSLDTNLRALRDIGLSTSALKQIILSSPRALQRRPAVPRIQFWRDFLGDDEAALVKAFKNNRGLITFDISGFIDRKLSLLQSHGLSTQDVQRTVLIVPHFITNSAQLMEDLLKRTKELGFRPGSKMFVHGLGAMIRVSPELLQRKMELFKSFGWSEQEFFSALRMAPSMVCLTDYKLRVKMHFLMGEAGCEPSYIASYPVLVKYSLEKRLRPRQHVLHLLESNGVCRKPAFYYAITVPDTKFVEKYIVPHKEKIPGLHESYLAAFT